MKIALDAFGGDFAPQATIEGCVQALNAYNDISVVLCGDESAIKAELKNHTYPQDRVEILHAPEIITLHESPTIAIKRKKESSMVKGLELLRDKQVDCFVSAGSTGALLAGATLIVRRLKGVKRPALATLLPTLGGCMMLLDCGANVDSKPEYLVQYALMGDAYMRQVMQVNDPKVGLLNNGEEEGKGNAMTKQAYTLLKDAPIGFAGNCEARDVLSGKFDVVVCDGFDGNIVLKHTEGLAETLVRMLKKELMADTRSKLGALLAKPAFRRFSKQMDYTEYGGAPLLGIDGNVIKAHGSSNAKAFCSAINQARVLIQGHVGQMIADGVAQLPEMED